MNCSGAAPELLEREREGERRAVVSPKIKLKLLPRVKLPRPSQLHFGPFYANFLGVHLGHVKVIKNLQKIFSELYSAVG